MQPACSQFIAAFRSAFAAGHFVKATLSKPGPVAAEGLKNVYLRPVALKSGMHVAFNYRYSTRDEVKNYLLDEAEQHLEALLGSVFLHADMYTGEADWVLQFGKNGHAQASRKRATAAAPPTTAHNREKHRLLDPSALWLYRLGITNARGEVLPTAQDKWRQINKYLEIIEGLLRERPLPNDACIADMGSGKGYLTFALYDFLTSRMGLRPQVTGIELRPKLVEFCEKTAREVGFNGLRFRSQDIAHYHPQRLDMLIALHACDTATDLALAAGIREHATLIVAAPCCHKQIRKSLHTRNEMAPLLRHGILEERQAEIITDGLRALLLESEGYRTAVFEFISTEHTAKNIMITAIRHPRMDAARRTDMRAKVQAIKQSFGITEHYLEHLLQVQADAAIEGSHSR